MKLFIKARVKDLILADGARTGCIYEKDGVDSKELGPMILASEGTLTRSSCRDDNSLEVFKQH